jgi:hypothetical protein
MFTRPAILRGMDLIDWTHMSAARLHLRKFVFLSVAEMRILRWFCGHTRRDKVRNDNIRDRARVTPIEEKLIQHRLRWFGHVQRRSPEASVRSRVLKRVDNIKNGRGRPKLTWDKSVKRDLKE